MTHFSNSQQVRIGSAFETIVAHSRSAYEIVIMCSGCASEIASMDISITINEVKCAVYPSCTYNGTLSTDTLIVTNVR